MSARGWLLLAAVVLGAYFAGGYVGYRVGYRNGWTAAPGGCPSLEER